MITLFFIVFYLSSGLIAGSKLLETVFGLDETLGVVVTLAAVGSYTFIGGFLAVSRTDVFQATLMLAAFVILPLWLIVVTDNPFEGLGETTSGFWNPFTDRKGEPLSVIFLLSTVGWGLGYLGSQRVVQRFMAVESETKIPQSRAIGTAWMFLVYLFALLLGLVALPALSEAGRLDDVTADPERVYLVATQVFFHPIVGGLLLSAAFAPVTIMALYWRRFNVQGAVAAMVTGTAAASIWGYSSGGPAGIMDLQPATPGCLTAVLAAVVVTLLTPRPSAATVALFNKVNAPSARPARP